jgi:hypothetical protein
LSLSLIDISIQKGCGEVGWGPQGIKGPAKGLSQQQIMMSYQERSILYIYIYFLNAPTGLTKRIDTSDKSPQKKIDNNSQIHSWLATMQNPTCSQSFLVLHLTTIPASHYITKAQNKANHAPVYELFPAIYKHWCW